MFAIKIQQILDFENVFCNIFFVSLYVTDMFYCIKMTPWDLITALMTTSHQ